MGYSTANPIKNKIAQKNINSQYISAISEYSAFVTDIVTVF